MIKKVATKAADGVSKLSELSPEQLEKVQDQMAAYRDQMPDLSGEAAEEYFRKQLAIAGVEVYNAYLPQLMYSEKHNRNSHLNLHECE